MSVYTTTASIQEIKGVGPKLSGELEAVGITTIKDALFYFPYRFHIFESKPLAEFAHDEDVTVEGEVLTEPVLSYFGRNKSRVIFTLEVENISIKAVIFNRSFAKKHISKGQTVTLTGKWDMHRLQVTVHTYQIGSIDGEAIIEPIYTVKGELTQNKLKKVIRKAMENHEDDLEETLPEQYLNDYKLPGITEAVRTMHQPENSTMLKHARRRLIYEEFLLFQIRMQLLRKIKREQTEGNSISYDPGQLQAFIDTLPYDLTQAQQRALEQILADMRSPYRMNRLLQGDVGSGKTAVAAICLYGAVRAGTQTAFMVPTEILARQHTDSLSDMFPGDISISLLTGSMTDSAKTEELQRIAAGESDIIIGTHALIQQGVTFSNLGFVIVDEQHRFGVEQRRILRNKGLSPDMLFMTATPIPRTMAITAFGDMDVSVIDEMPKGRQHIATYWVKEDMLERVLTFIGKNIANGEQAYVVCPLIEESDALDIQNAVDLYQTLRDFYPERVRVGLMHGRLDNDEKEQIMQAFAMNEIHILVSTTVVEVGVDVPNATTMLIHDAQRFGLAQLHQLRGRVGRGSKKSHCILMANPEGETGRERMRIMTETNDGFSLSEKDLKLRGPGDFFGKKQSGIPEFRVADMVRDYRALETARQDAETIVENDLLYTDPAFRTLQQEVEKASFLHEKLD